MTDPGPREGAVSGDDRRLHWVGRTERRAGKTRFWWSGSGFIAQFFGTGLTAQIRDADHLFTVVIDGTASEIEPGQRSGETVCLANGLPPGKHRLELYRRTEPLFGPSELLAVQVIQGELLEPLVPRRTIELIGDSISCGYGNLAAHPNVPFGPDTQNHYLSYGAVLARDLDAQLSTIAWSGRGVVRNYADEPGLLVPQLYELTSPTQDSPRWPFADRVDATIINLGTNDFATEPGPGASQFVAAYVRLLEAIRQRRPTTAILCTLGPMLPPSTLRSAQRCVAQAVARRARGGDARVFFHALRTPNEAPGSDEHPSVPTHRRIARELYDVVLSLL